MGAIFFFRRNKRHFDWLRGITPRKRQWSLLIGVPIGFLTGAAIAGAAIYLDIPKWELIRFTRTQPVQEFGLCFIGGGWNCVVDGDTFWNEGLKIQIADIDAPETHPPRCLYEANLGNRATVRLQELLNQGPFTLHSIDRDEDRYGRKLRVVMRDGQSLGMRLVEEGLARAWTGSRKPWC